MKTLKEKVAELPTWRQEKIERRAALLMRRTENKAV